MPGRRRHTRRVRSRTPECGLSTAAPPQCRVIALQRTGDLAELGHAILVVQLPGRAHQLSGLSVLVVATGYEMISMSTSTKWRSNNFFSAASEASMFSRLTVERETPASWPSRESLADSVPWKRCFAACALSGLSFLQSFIGPIWHFSLPTPAAHAAKRLTPFLAEEVRVIS